MKLGTIALLTYKVDRAGENEWFLVRSEDWCLLGGEDSTIVPYLWIAW